MTERTNASLRPAPLAASTAPRARAPGLFALAGAVFVGLVALPLLAPRSVHAVVPAPPPPPPNPALRGILAGRYSPAPGASNAANRDAGVQRACDALFFAIRPIAFGRIVDGNPVFPSLTIAFPEGMIEVQSPPVTARSPDNGTMGSMMGLDRERNNLTQRLTSDALVQTSWNDAGRRVTRFLPSGNGRLILQIEVTSPRLPVPVRYTMAYQHN